MTETTELVPTNIEELQLDKFGDDVFDKVSSDSYLPYLQLCSSSSKFCKEAIVPINNYCIVQNQSPKDLGKEFDALIIALIFSALQF